MTRMSPRASLSLEGRGGSSFAFALISIHFHSIELIFKFKDQEASLFR